MHRHLGDEFGGDVFLAHRFPCVLASRRQQRDGILIRTEHGPAAPCTHAPQRNGRDTPEALYQIIYGGKGKMPGYGQDCAPKVPRGQGQTSSVACVPAGSLPGCCCMRLEGPHAPVPCLA